MQHHAARTSCRKSSTEPRRTSVSCDSSLTELREGDFLQLGLGEQRVFAGHCEYRLRQRKDGLAIAMKKVVLISRYLPIENLSFLL